MSSEPSSSSNSQADTTNPDDVAAIIKESIELRHKADILQSIPDLVLAFDISGQIFFASRSALDFLGFDKAEEIQGKLFWNLFTTESKKLIQKAFEDALTAKQKEEDDSTPLAGGKPMLVTVLLREEKGRQEVHKFSLKGTACVNDNVPECVCSLRLVENDHGNRDYSDAIVSDNEEGKAINRNESALMKRSAAAAGDSQVVPHKRTKSNYMNHVSDEGSSK